MANTNPSKRLWTEYGTLKRWTAGSDPAAQVFRIETSSFEDPTIASPSDSNNNGTASTTLTVWVSIVGSIYPATEPFRQRGLRVELRVPATYPHEPPEVYMRMNIRHPNIEKNGE